MLLKCSDPEGGVTNSHLEAFIEEEQFPHFPKIEGGGGLNEYSHLNKKLVIVVLEEYEHNETKKFQQER